MARRRAPVGREAWTIAALKALVCSGMEGVAVEPLAQALGVTKGSFYWHFESRAELVAALAEHWEKLGTDDIIAQLDLEPDVRRRLEQFAQSAWDRPDHLNAERALSGAAVSDPAIGKIVARVHAKRRKFLLETYRRAGLDRRSAAARAATVHALYEGAVQLSMSPPFHEPRALRAWLQSVMPVLLP